MIGLEVENPQDVAGVHALDRAPTGAGLDSRLLTHAFGGLKGLEQCTEDA